MPMKRLEVDALRVGMKFSKSLFDNNLNIVLPAGKVLDNSTLLNLKNRNIKYVETAGELVEIIEQDNKGGSKITTLQHSEKKSIIIDKDTAKYLDFYKESINSLNTLYNNYRNNKTIIPDEFQKLATRIVNTIMAEKRSEVFINIINIAGKGDYLANHTINTTILSVLLGQKLGYSLVKLVNLALAALVYDIGMVKIPAYILEKEDKLSQEEYNQVKTHPIYSYQIITKELNFPIEIARVGLEHHEKFDGSGYPRRLKGTELSDMSKIISIADTYEALTKDRVYREGKDGYDAMKLVLGEGSKKFDPEILKVFISMMSIYPVGSIVQLSSGAIAVVTSSDPVSPFRPTVKVIRDEFGDELEDGPIIRLSREKDIHIIKVIHSKQYSDELKSA